MAANSYPVYDISGFDMSQRGVLIMPLPQYIGIHSQKLYRPHRHAFYHAVYFTRGTGIHYIDFDRFEVAPSQIYFMSPGQVHHWEFGADEVDGYVLNFSASFFQSFLLRPDYVDELAFFQGQTDDAIMRIPAELQAKVRTIFDEMVTLWESINPGNLDKIRVLTLQLLLYVADLCPSVQHPTRSYKHTVLRNFRRLVDSYFTQWRHPKDYADLLYITPNHLNALCSDILGYSAGEVIRNRVVLEAKRLLVNPERTISSIAYELNFKDNSYFSRFFKKHTGSSPEAFRKRQSGLH